MKEVSAYIDESGNHDLDTSKSGASKYFIICAILVNNKNLDHLHQEVESIRKRHFQTGEIKSSGIRNTDDGHKRRIKILKEVLSLDFHFFAIAVDKAALSRDSGFQYKKSFLKFVNGLLYNRLFSTYTNIKIYADEHGGEDFKESFRKYIEKNHKPDLFWKSDLQLVSSKNNVLVQLADFIVGTVAKIYEGKKNPALSEQYLRLLKEKGLGLVEWPTKHQFYFPPDTTPPEYDQFIHQHALAKAEVFLEENHKHCDDEILLQICVLGYLVFQSRLAPDKNYISTKELLNHLNERGFVKVTEQAIRSTIISKLRDRDVIIASCNRGYKIPRHYADLVDFVERVNSLVVPLLERLNKARNSYLLASHKEIDLLKGPNYPHLVAFLEELNKKKT